MSQQELVSRKKTERYSTKAKPFNALKAWIKLSEEVQNDFRERGITKEDVEDAIIWARRRVK